MVTRVKCDLQVGSLEASLPSRGMIGKQEQLRWRKEEGPPPTVRRDQGGGGGQPSACCEEESRLRRLLDSTFLRMQMLGPQKDIQSEKQEMFENTVCQMTEKSSLLWVPTS